MFKVAVDFTWLACQLWTWKHEPSVGEQPFCLSDISGVWHNTIFSEVLWWNSWVALIILIVKFLWKSMLVMCSMYHWLSSDHGQASNYCQLHHCFNQISLHRQYLASYICANCITICIFVFFMWICFECFYNIAV